MEAMNVLRIEKGHITHAEIHGRTTAFDIGMEALVNRTKDCIGQAGAARPGLSGANRDQLIGLKPLVPTQELTAGAHLFRDGAKAVRENDQGYVTSVCWSPTLDSYLGLAFLTDGRARHGEVIEMVDHLRGVATRCTVCAPQFYDPDGGRLRG